MAYQIILKTRQRNVPFDKIPQHLPTFYSALERDIGKASPIVETAIAKKLYQKLQLEFSDAPNRELSKYVENA